MPYCPNCGVDNPPASRFCDQCGAALIPVPASAPPAASPPVIAPPPPRQMPASVASVGPVICPQCGASAIPGEAFCDNCGAPLNAPAPVAQAAPALSPQPVYPAPQPAPSYTPPPAAPAYTPVVAVPSQRTTLAPARLSLESGETLAVPNTPQAVIGRADPVSQFTPDIDLSDHGALTHGVGRRHARLFIQQGQVLIEDLDSTNGSTLNGVRLVPRQPQPVRAGDTIQLGSLRLQFLL